MHQPPFEGDCLGGGGDVGGGDVGGRFMVGVLLGGGSSDLEPGIPEDGLLGGVLLRGGSSATVGCDVGRWRPNGGLLAS